MWILQMEITNAKTRGMHGHKILLNILFGLLIAENGFVLEALTPIQDLQVDYIPYSSQIPFEIILQYFTNEKDVVFKKLETMYGIGEQASKLNPFRPGGRDQAKKQKKMLSLAYGTLLALWIAIDFRICTLIFSRTADHGNEENEIQKQRCHSFFKEMYFAFLQFRGRLEGMRIVTGAVREIGGRPVQGTSETEAVHRLLLLTSDFILDMDTLDKQTADEQWSQFFSWWSDLNDIKDGKITKRPSSLFSYKYRWYQSTNNTIEHMYNRLYLLVETRMLFELRNDVLPILTKLVIPDSNDDFLYFWDILGDVVYTTKLRMWKMLTDYFTVDPQAKKQHRISKAIGIMKQVRLMHFTVLYKNPKFFEQHFFYT